MELFCGIMLGNCITGLYYGMRLVPQGPLGPLYDVWFENGGHSGGGTRLPQGLQGLFPFIYSIYSIYAYTRMYEYIGMYMYMYM